MLNFGYKSCCGLREISNLGYTVRSAGVKQAILDVKAAIQNRTINCAFLIFTQATYRGDPTATYGEEFHDYIVKHNLGTITRTQHRRNPNSESMLYAYMWAPNKKAILEHKV